MQDIWFVKLLLQITGVIDDGPDFGIIIKLLDMGVICAGINELVKAGKCSLGLRLKVWAKIA